LDRLGDVLGLDAGGFRAIGDGAGDFAGNEAVEAVRLVWLSHY